jgi:hypothetical protein
MISDQLHLAGFLMSMFSPSFLLHWAVSAEKKDHFVSITIQSVPLFPRQNHIGRTGMSHPLSSLWTALARFRLVRIQPSLPFMKWFLTLKLLRSYFDGPVFLGCKA